VLTTALDNFFAWYGNGADLFGTLKNPLSRGSADDAPFLDIRVGKYFGLNFFGLHVFATTKNDYVF
jgi:hypothetical protein